MSHGKYIFSIAHRSRPSPRPRYLVTNIYLLQGCCHSKPPGESGLSPYHGSSTLEDDSSRAITTSPPTNPGTPGPRTSATAPAASQRSRSRRNTAPGEQFNAPLRPHVWTSKRQWTRSQLDRERREFFDTRVSGHSEIWATLRTVIELLADDDINTAQSILDAAAITVPTGDLKNGAYDVNGNLYQLPEYIISDPSNILLDNSRKEEGTEILCATDDEEEMEKLAEEKGKGVLGNEVDKIRVRARLSDRGGPDVVVQVGSDQPVRKVINRIKGEANVRCLVLVQGLSVFLTFDLGYR